VEPGMSEITELLQGNGGPPDFKAIFDRLYPELKIIARSRIASLGPGETLTPTALVHEAYLRLIDNTHLDFKGRRYFFACAAKAMRNIVVDQIRSSSALKRGGDRMAVTLSDNLPGVVDGQSVLDLDRALDELDEINPDQRELVELKFFSGLTIQEIADIQRVSPRTAAREWQRARAFLHLRLKESESPGQENPRP
jgi:RNA polymerase sigma factor (TIGR02999 family)